ncbi:MAG: hypothetical protein II447_05000, partial [Bacteroidaceae bacterium]|nr:hypothetical protein [Bacteroidaceae bacterium]
KESDSTFEAFQVVFKWGGHGMVGRKVWWGVRIVNKVSEGCCGILGDDCGCSRFLFVTLQIKTVKKRHTLLTHRLNGRRF